MLLDSHAIFLTTFLAVIFLGFVSACIAQRVYCTPRGDLPHHGNAQIKKRIWLAAFAATMAVLQVALLVFDLKDFRSSEFATIVEPMPIVTLRYTCVSVMIWIALSQFRPLPTPSWRFGIIWVVATVWLAIATVFLAKP